MKRSLFSCFSLLLLLALMAGCQSTKKDFVGVDGDYVTGSPLPDRQEGVSFLGGNVSRGDFEPIYFNFDSFSIAGSEAGKITAIAAAMRNGNANIIVAGFTDESGTEEYNRVLGERRALAVRDALITEGISGARIRTVSFGEELPANPGSGESAWSKNRRAEIGVVR